LKVSINTCASPLARAFSAACSRACGERRRTGGEEDEEEEEEDEEEEDEEEEDEEEEEEEEDGFMCYQKWRGEGGYQASESAQRLTRCQELPRAWSCCVRVPGAHLQLVVCTRTGAPRGNREEAAAWLCGVDDG
jgi:alkylation response protein AidB-like acyl-CoA dehydrogenase